VNYFDPVGLLGGTVAPLYMGEETLYHCQFLPTYVCFGNVLFVEWDPGPAVNHWTWPDGTVDGSAEGYADYPFYPDLQNMCSDDDRFLNVPIGRLEVQDGWVDFSFTELVYELFLDCRSEWTHFVTAEHQREWCGLPSAFGGEWGQGRAIVCDVAGPWMGPWLLPF
jgi:hypothetical protein